jgi:polyisoprenyl-teichoic acid--peptidoglycan teichoic acid transferase
MPVSRFGEETKTAKPNFQDESLDVPFTKKKYGIEPEVEDNYQKPPRKKRSFGKVFSYLIILVCFGFFSLFGVVAFSAISTSGEVTSQGQSKGLLGILGDFGSILNPVSQTQVQQTNGKTNVLILGTAQGGTDTIIIASYYHQEKAVAAVNIPRDFYVSDKYHTGKINGLYVAAENVKEGTGGRYVANFLEEEFGIEIHYWGTVDFQGVEKAIDELGGIEVNVENSFTDCQFPAPGYRGYLPCQTFSEGPQIMDGETALIYARSRHGNNGEGSDFARSARQQKVIQAALTKAKQKISSGEIVLNPQSLTSYMDIFQKNVKTSAELDEMMAFYNIFQDINKEEIRENYYSLNWSTDNGLLCPTQTNDGAYVIRYCDGTIAGGKGTSKTQKKAQEQIQNLLYTAQTEELFEAEVAILGNQSNDVVNTYNKLVEMGFNESNLTYNQYYQEIKIATATSVEKTTIYISDPKLRELFIKANQKNDMEFEVKAEIPADVEPGKYSDYPIIAWSETVSD